MLPKVLIYWPLLAIAIVAILCALIRRAKAADRTLGIQRSDRQPGERKAATQDNHDDSDRRAA